jgi:hypothetical protein
VRQESSRSHIDLEESLVTALRGYAVSMGY